MSRTKPILLFAVVTFFVSGAATLTNQSIAELVKSHFSDEVILQIISSEPGSYDTSVEGLLALKRVGASDRIISALIGRLGSNIGTSAEPSRDTINSDTGKDQASHAQRSQAMRAIFVDGTPVRLRTLKTLSSANASVGDEVDLQLVESLRTDGGVVIQRRAPAIGRITDVRKAGLASRGGKLVLQVDYLSLPSGERLPLRMFSLAGQFNLLREDSGFVVASPTQWPTAAFVLRRGKEAILRRDTVLTVYTDAAPDEAGGSPDRQQ